MSYVGIDYGARRIGIAVSDSGVLATPHSVVRNEGDVVATLAALVDELSADTIILGLPKRPNSSGHERTYRDLAERLRQKTCKEVVLWDETLSTADAASRLREAGRKRRDAEREIDMHAAAVILQSYLDAHPGRTP
jgi:putative Holliday junction resolvase